MLARRPRGGYAVPLPPADVSTVTIDPSTGQLGTEDCPELITEVFLRDQVPDVECALHSAREPFRRFWRWGSRRRSAIEEPDRPARRNTRRERAKPPVGEGVEGVEG
jgi:hypothetical protein